jgi:hypothetical protein
MGCTEKHIAFKIPVAQVIQIHRATPPDTYPPINSPEGQPSSVATGVAGAIIGAAAGAAWMSAQRFKSSREAIADHPPKPPEDTPGGPWMPKGQG